MHTSKETDKRDRQKWPIYIKKDLQTRPAFSLDTYLAMSLTLTHHFLSLSYVCARTWMATIYVYICVCRLYIYFLRHFPAIHVWPSLSHTHTHTRIFTFSLFPSHTNWNTHTHKHIHTHILMYPLSPPSSLPPSLSLSLTHTELEVYDLLLSELRYAWVCWYVSR